MNQFPTSQNVLPTSGQTGAPQHDDIFDIFNLFGVLWRSKWLILFFVVLFGAAGWFYANKVATSLYTSTTRLAFQVRSQQVVDVESVLSGVSTEQPAINTELGVIRSRRVIGLLVDELELTEDVEFNGLGKAPLFSKFGIRNMITEWFTGEEVTPTRPDEETLRLRTTLNVQRKIQVRPIRNTYLFEILVTTQNRRKSALLADTLANLYINDQVTVKFEATRHAVNWLTEQIADLEQQIDAIEDQIETLRTTTDLVSPEAAEVLNLRAKGIQNRLTSERAALDAKKEHLEALVALSQKGDPAAITEGLDDPITARLSQRDLSDPSTAQAIVNRLQTLTEKARNDVQRIESQVEALEESSNRLSQQVANQTESLNALNRLQRDREATNVLHETFLVRLKETSIQIGLQQPDSRVLSEAAPGTPVAPRRLRIQVGMAFLGFAIGAAIALLREIRHTGFRNAKSLERKTGISVIGQVPKIPISRRDGLLQYFTERPTSAAAEAIRNLRTSLLLSNIDNPPKVIMSTSSVPGEGKTTQAICLAQNLRGLGKSVLLVEGDIRRRTLAKYFNTAPKGSLLRVLNSEITLQDAVEKDPETGINVLMSERSNANAADIFSSQRFQQFLENARQTFDFVIIDTPPVLIVPDARIIGRQVDTTIYSVKWDATGEEQVREGLNQLLSVDCNISGLVLSQIDAAGMKSYGYGNQYGAYSSYGKSYYDA
ncbi:Tyrosine-protein kinase ptk [Falsiruegeria litorea R37]|uniref:non-specific protein-tyrosine kinase n=1 Tax=Falsiruegeria litorea R37 TaxID=1200284 RepID=A0A1Y5U1D9_9RHOB|nr:polysaccharide biosynthesis tyrosine autokinase [Falsiruegeria litorea]SLN74421.1 Tyrosine-protein kinase ptk [Falsiruegeria litorea R37]